ncbi:MAG: cytochrome b N-terminal domain-containing protein [Desulfobacterales bacterium]|nr:cytochrome b N-terminal domain-containing protein [Desulfobacterales bacterium]
MQNESRDHEPANSKKMLAAKPFNTFVSFIKHIHPVKIPLSSLAFKCTWGLGGMSLVLAFMLMVTGILMQLAYKPLPGIAYESVQLIKNDILFGQLVRNIHYFSANFLVIVAFCHMLRVFFTSGFYGTRRVNWIIGICIFLLILLSCFTGYLLPWDQTAYWAVTICINMFEYIPSGSFFKNFVTDGYEVSTRTLQMFFTLHTTLIPSILIILFAIHFWKIRKAGGVVFPGTHHADDNIKPVMVKSNPNLFLRETVVGAVLIAFILSISLVFNAPLDDIANSGLSPNPAKAPWYFSGLQELLVHFHPLFAVFIIPVLALLLLFFTPFITDTAAQKGVWFISDKAKKAGFISALFSIICVPGFILLDEYVVNFQLLMPDMVGVISTGLIPFSIVIAFIFIFYYLMKRKFNLSINEAFQTIFIFLTTAYIVLTVTGTWLRGPGMKLIW